MNKKWFKVKEIDIAGTRFYKINNKLRAPSWLVSKNKNDNLIRIQWANKKENEIILELRNNEVGFFWSINRTKIWVPLKNVKIYLG